jgi:NADH-quinone oxidoreductase subunit G
MSEKTAADHKLENDDKVIISNARGSITIKLEIIEMVNDVVWIPANNHDSKVKSKLGAKEGDIVTIQKGNF